MRLSRASWPGSRPADPVRLVHLGPGPFFRAHAAWYTEHAADRYGIAAVSSRSSADVERLSAQDGLYSLDDGERFEVVQSVSEAAPLSRLSLLVGREEVCVVTVTVSEAGYDSPAIAALAASLVARAEVGAPPIACCSLDNLPANGRHLEAAVAAALERSGRQLPEGWCRFPSSEVDRITPPPTDDDRAQASARLGLEDEAAVVTEPYAEWCVEDDFPSGRPAWERAGATLVTEVAPYEARKLRLLNAAHCACCYLGAPRGHRTVAEAMADEAVASLVHALLAEAASELPLDCGEYAEAVERRLRSDRPPYPLSKIAEHGPAKLAARLGGTLADARAAGRMPVATVEVLAAYRRHLLGRSGLALSAEERTVAPTAEAVLALAQPQLASDAALVRALESR